MKPLKNMKPTGNRIINVYCGLVQGLDHKVVFGCHAKPIEQGYTEYWYEVSKGLFSTVVICPKCELNLSK